MKEIELFKHIKDCIGMFYPIVLIITMYLLLLAMI